MDELRYALDEVRARQRAGASLRTAVEAVAQALRRPAPALQAAARSHADLVAPGDAVRVCRGTSCELRGAAELERALAGAAAVRPVHCLGHCHRSPVVLDARGGLHVDAHPARIAVEIERVPSLPAAPRIEALGGPAIVTHRIGRGDFSQLPKARADGAYRALERVRSLGSAGVLRELERSGERGRGGGGFPTAAKWRAAAERKAPAKVVVANGDEGDPGSFVDRVLLERDPHGVLEGLALSALAVGATLGVVFVRSEYPRAAQRMREAAREAARAGALGGLAVDVVEGFGSYVCGEETALLAALEGERGEVRPRPPYPAERGLFGLPTVVNNVETLVNVPWIVEHGGAAYAALGTPHSRGTKALCLASGFAQPGIVEVPFGVVLRDVIQDWGATSCSADDLAGVWLGGPMGSFLAPEACDVVLCGRELAARGVRLGHGGLVAVPHDADLVALATHLLGFVASESCGRCTPCRDGAARAHALALEGVGENAAALDALLRLMSTASLCPFGRDAPAPIRALLARAGVPLPASVA